MKVTSSGAAMLKALVSDFMRTRVWLVLAIFLLGSALTVWAQTGGQAGIQGLVKDPGGAAIPRAIVTLANEDTLLETTRLTTRDGLFNITPIQPGSYTISVTAQGFTLYVQKNVTLDAMVMSSLNIQMKPGAATETVTITDAPPMLETNNATLGTVMENRAYTNLPILMSGQQRDPTAFASLLPGAQSGSRAPVIGGTSNYSAELYIDGIPLTIASQQGDNRVIYNSLPIEAIDQFQVLTSAIPPEYQGAGLLNFTTKFGTAQYHGSANVYLRNTVFDTWTYAQKHAKALGEPVNNFENQNEVVGSLGGPIPYLKKRGFFQVTYDRYHGRQAGDPTYLTLPTTKMRQGDFSEWLSLTTPNVIYDPTTQATCTKNTGATCRYAFGEDYADKKVSTASATNIIPTTYLSPIAQYMQKFLPAVSNSNLTDNYLGSMPSGYDNWETAARADYKISESQMLTLVYVHGLRKNAPYSYLDTNYMPLPYTHGIQSSLITNIGNIYHTWSITPNLDNQFKAGFVDYNNPVKAPTDGSSVYSATAAGITNLPAGQAASEFPGVTFGSDSTSPTTWTYNGQSGATSITTSVDYFYSDNLHWAHGKHFFTFGGQIQFMQADVASYLGKSGITSLTFTTDQTASLTSTSTNGSNTGVRYADFMLGGVGTGSTSIQTYSTMGGRYHPFAPYVNDDWHVTSKLTLNLGVRWDYLPPYTESHDRWSFMNPSLTNTATGNLGMLQFAGNNGSASCNCKTPVQTYYKNFGPRAGFAYQLNDKTVIRGGAGLYYTHGGGTGGRTGAAVGTGQQGYTSTPSYTETAAAPAFWLNNSSYWQSAGISNTDFGGTGATLDQPAGATAAGQLQNTGYYLNSSGTFVTSATSVSYADPYLSGRSPEFVFFNFGIQRQLRPTTTISVDYVGSESHFIAPASTSVYPVGYWSNKLDPVHMVALGMTTTKGLQTSATAATGTKILAAAATTTNVGVAHGVDSSITVPYSGFEDAAAKSSKATVQQMLLAFPQYAGVNNTWGNVGNNSYHSVQVTVVQREWKGLDLQANYTYSKNLGDDGTYRSGYDIPAAAIDGGTHTIKRGRADRSATSISIPHMVRVFGVYQLPFGKNQIGSNNAWVRNIAGGWVLSGIYTYYSGAPLAVVGGSTCYSTGGTCMPSLNPAYGKKKATLSNKWSMDQSNIDATAFIAPTRWLNTTTTSSAGVVTCSICTSPYGNAPRTKAYGLSYPNHYRLDMGLKREFDLPWQQMKLAIRATCTDVTHEHYFSAINTTLPTEDPATRAYSTSGTSFGEATTASDKRDWQFGAHITF